MKKLVLNIILVMLIFPAMSQGWVFISGTVTDVAGGYPLTGHAVTVMSDSTGGFFYYNTVYTDSLGHYFDDVPVMQDSTGGVLFIQTLDCQDSLHQAVVFYSPANYSFIQDFQLCSSNVSCEANFSYYTDPQGSPDSFQFTDLSSGNITAWSWSFGDGTGSNEQNPFHAFPGPGTFTICLTVAGNNCTSTSCQDIIISDTVYNQVYGQVFAGNFPLPEGVVQMFVLNPNGSYSPFGDAFQVDSNGVYYFTLVPAGTYLLQAVPGDSSGYLPTYFGDVIEWQQATQLVLGLPDNPYEINLVPAGQLSPGPGSVAGRINIAGTRSYAIDKINMMLMNESLVPIGFSRVSNAGEFNFPSLAYGTYYLRAELSGAASDNMKIEITAENPHADVTLSYTGNSILDAGGINPAKTDISLYPNPVHEQLTISFSMSRPGSIDIEVYSITGQLAFHSSGSAIAGENSFSVPFNDLPPGIYTLRMYSSEGINVIRKVIRN